ncbi:hypothetical protein [Dactylosporangium sp. NPDC050588]
MTSAASSTALIVVDLMPRVVERELGPHRGADVVARVCPQAGKPA